MTICPIAIAVGCKKCPIFKVCPVKSLIGDMPKAEAKPAAKPAAKSAAKPATKAVAKSAPARKKARK